MWHHRQIQRQFFRDRMIVSVGSSLFSELFIRTVVLTVFKILSPSAFGKQERTPYLCKVSSTLQIWKSSVYRLPKWCILQISNPLCLTWDWKNVPISMSIVLACRCISGSLMPACKRKSNISCWRTKTLYGLVYNNGSCKRRASTPMVLSAVPLSDAIRKVSDTKSNVQSARRHIACRRKNRCASHRLESVRHTVKTLR